MSFLEPLFGALWAIFSVFFRPSPDGLVVLLGVIVPLAAFAGTKLWQVEQHLDAEEQGLQKCHQALQARAATGQRLTESDLLEWKKQLPHDSLVARMLDSFWAVRSVANPDVEAIGTMLAQSEAARLVTLRAMPNRLLLAGLLGTVVSLAGVVAHLGPQLEQARTSGNALGMVDSLAATLQQMQTAFSCTAWGIVAAIVVGWRTQRAAQRQSDLLARVQQFGIQEFSQRIFPESQEAQLRDMQQAVEAGRRFLETIQGIMDGAAQRFGQVLGDASRTMAATMQALLQVAGDVRQGATSLERSTQELQVYHADLRSAHQELLGLFDTSQRELKQQAESQLSRMHELQLQFAQEARQIAGRMEHVGEGIQEVKAAVLQAGAQFDSGGRSLVEALQSSSTGILNALHVGFQNATESIQSVFEAHRNTADHALVGINNSHNAIVQELGALMERLDPRLLPQGEWPRVSGALEACAVRLGELSEGRERQAAEALAQLERIVRTAQQAAQAAQQAALATQQAAQALHSAPPPVAVPAPAPVPLASSETGPMLERLRQLLANQNPLPALEQIERAVQQLRDELRLTLKQGVRVRLFGPLRWWPWGRG